MSVSLLSPPPRISLYLFLSFSLPFPIPFISINSTLKLCLPGIFVFCPHSSPSLGPHWRPTHAKILTTHSMILVLTMQDGSTPNLSPVCVTEENVSQYKSLLVKDSDSSASFGGCDIWHLLTYNPSFLNDFCDNHSCKDYTRVLVRASVPVIKYHDQKQLGEETLGFSLQLVCCSSF